MHLAKLTTAEYIALRKQREAAGESLPTIICARSTYTEKNALAFKPYFEQWEKTGEEVVAPYLEVNCLNNAPLTVKRKSNDALNWLINNAETAAEKERWQRIRVRIDVLPLSDGILIVTRQHKCHGAKSRLAFASETKASINWKQAVFEYLDVAEADSPPFHLKGLTLSSEDIEFVKTIANQHNFLAKVTSLEITLLKNVQ